MWIMGLEMFTWFLLENHDSLLNGFCKFHCNLLVHFPEQVTAFTRGKSHGDTISTNVQEKSIRFCVHTNVWVCTVSVACQMCALLHCPPTLSESPACWQSPQINSTRHPHMTRNDPDLDWDWTTSAKELLNSLTRAKITEHTAVKAPQPTSGHVVEGTPPELVHSKPEQWQTETITGQNQCWKEKSSLNWPTCDCRIYMARNDQKCLSLPLLRSLMQMEAMINMRMIRQYQA
jgi:hypothetical protein